MPDACRKAEACDVVSPVQLAGTSTEDWSQSLLVFDSGTIRTAMIGRVKALVELGETSKAESELLTYAQFWSKYNLPLNWSDGRSTAVGGASGCLQLASELCREGKVSDRTIREILSLSFDGDRLFAEAMAGEVVWACLLLRRGEYSLRKPGWFEWLSARQSTPPGWGVYESPFLRFGQRAEYCHEVRALLMHDLQFLHLVRNPKPWDQVEPVDISCEWCWGYFVQALPEESMGFRQVNMAWLELKLHSLQRKSGPLHNQRAAVERLLGEQPYAGYRWKGTTLVIFPVPIMEFAPGYTESGENAQRVLEIRLDPTD